MDSNHTPLAVISFDSALKKDESYYLQCFWKYNEKETKVIRHIIDGLESSSNDSD